MQQTHVTAGELHASLRNSVECRTIIFHPKDSRIALGVSESRAIATGIDLRCPDLFSMECGRTDKKLTSENLYKDNYHLHIYVMFHEKLS